MKGIFVTFSLVFLDISSLPIPKSFLHLDKSFSHFNFASTSSDSLLLSCLQSFLKRDIFAIINDDVPYPITYPGNKPIKLRVYREREVEQLYFHLKRERSTFWTTVSNFPSTPKAAFQTCLLSKASTPLHLNGISQK